MYRWYLQKQLKKHPDWWLESDRLLRAKGIYNLMKPGGVHMTYTWFRAILERNNTLAREAVIQGKCYSLSLSVGFLLARRIERDFSKPKMNIIETYKYRKANGGDLKIYHTDEDYCRIAWHKEGYCRNESFYEFLPCRQMKTDFSKAIKTQPLLKYKFLFFPIRQYSNGSKVGNN